MKTAGIVLLALLAVGCGAPGSSRGVIDAGKLASLVSQARADVGSALAMAQAAGHQPGIACHTAALAALDSIKLPVFNVTGPASLGETIALQELALREVRRKWEDVQAACTGLYPVSATFGKVFSLMQFRP
jgi:hypothetical protein